MNDRCPTIADGRQCIQKRHHDLSSSPGFARHVFAFKETEYLLFVDLSNPDLKTKRVSVYARRDGAVLGHIRWHGPWRQYAFMPEGSCIFNKGCMNDIIEVIDSLMAERKQARAAVGDVQAGTRP